MKLPAPCNKVDGRVCVFDQGAILDVLAYWVAVYLFGGCYIFESCFTQHRIRPDPKRCTVVSKPLVNEILNIGCGACNSFYFFARIGDRTVGGLDNRHL